MKLYFNDTHMTFLDMEIKDVLLLLVIKLHDSPRIRDLSSEIVGPMIKKGYVEFSRRANGYVLTALGEQRVYELQTMPEEKEGGKESKKDKEIADLVERMRELFPTGMKVKNTAWRGNRRENVLRLKKFFKLYGKTYTDQQILDATKRYVDSFHGDYKYMRVLPYFIMKSPMKMNADGEYYVEEKSDLATFLENPSAGNRNSLQNDDDWADNMR